MNFKLKEQFKVLSFNFEEKVINISYTDIKTIHDNEGTDITEKILRDYYRADNKVPGEIIKDTLPADTALNNNAVDIIDDSSNANTGRFENQWRSENDEEVKAYKKKLWDVGVSLGPCFSIPAGDYYDGIDAGVGFGGGITLAVTNNIALRGSISRTGLKWDYEISFKTMRYMFSVLYYHRLDRATPGRTIHYLTTGLGAVSHNASYMDLSYTESKFTTEIGGGFIQLLSENVGIDAGLIVDLLYIGTYDDGYSSHLQTALLIEFKVS